MILDKDTKNELKRLEESLWKRETRFDKTYMRSIISEDFFEFGRSGKIYTIDTTLSAPDQEINAVLPLKEFTIHEIDENVVLLTYISEAQYDVLEVSNRSSLWLKTENGWKLKFHQGTPTALQ